jgi:HlyD family secretion protein
MADLSRVRMRALVVETDIGKVKEGQAVTVVADAYPQRSFRGVVEKIEPQAVVQQSVTMFPVLISISNAERLLLPGMNGEVTMLVDERRDALAVPVDALRSVREMSVLAASLGLEADSLRTLLRRGGAAGQAAATDAAVAASDGAAAASGRAAVAPGALRDSAFRRPGAGADSARAGRWRRGGGFPGGQMDPERLARWRERMAARASDGASGPGEGGFGPPPGTAGSGPSAAAGSSRSAGTAAGAASAAGRGSSRIQVAVVKTAGGLEPRTVRVGISDYEYTEVLSGLEEGDVVLMLGLVELQRQRDQMVSRVRERVGGGVTGTTASSGTGRRSGGN